MKRADAIAAALIAADRVPDLEAGVYAVERTMVDNFPDMAFDDWNSRPCHCEPKPEDARHGLVERVVLFLILKVSDVDDS